MTYVLAYRSDDKYHEQPRVAFGPFADLQAAIEFMIEANAQQAAVVESFDKLPVGVPILSVQEAERLYDKHVKESE